MANYTDILETQHALEATVLDKISRFEAQLKAEVPQTSNSMTKLDEEFQEFKSHVHSVLGLLQQQIAAVAGVLDNIEMRHRRKYLLFNGIPEDINPTLEDFIVQILRDRFEFKDLSKKMIAVCHRLGKPVEGKCRPVLLRFTEPTLKSDVWRKKTALKGTSYSMAEFLTRHRQSLFILARKRLGTRRCWTTDGNVIVKLSDGTIQRVFTNKDLDHFVPGNAETPAIVSQASPTSGTSEARTKSKRSGRTKK